MKLKTEIQWRKPKIVKTDEELVTIPSKTLHFIRDVAVGVYESITDFVKGCVNHAAAIIGLGGMTIGFTYLISELPFLYLLPAFVESVMFAPVCAVLIVWGLCKLMGWQLNHKWS